MKINVEGLAPNLRHRAIPKLEAIPGLDAHFLPQLSTVPVRMVFEVRDDVPLPQAVGLFKMTMFQTFGMGLVWRVVPHGVLYEK